MRTLTFCLPVLLTWLIAVGGHRRRTTKDKSGLNCPTPAHVRHGSFRVRFDGIQVEYNCDRGYLPVGPIIALCAGQHWTDDPPVCVAAGCPEIERVSHGSVKISYEGGLARFKCDDGYKLSGPEVISCDGRYWNDTHPYCSSTKSAIVKELSGVNGKSNRVKDPNANRRERKYPARSHHEWLEEADYTCVQDEKTITPPPVANAIAYTRWAVFAGEPRLYTLYRCKWGFTHVANLKHLYCQDGDWAGNLPRCVLAVSTTSAPLHESYQRDERRVSSGSMSHDAWLRLADYSCLGRVGARHEKVEPPSVAHSASRLRYAVYDGLPHLYIHYKCAQGYTLQRGAGFMYCRHRRWQGDIPTCVQHDVSVTERTQTNPCMANNGGCSHVCVWSQGETEPRCACRRGYQLAADNKDCTDVNECDHLNGGCGSQLCENTEGSFRCECRPGYIKGHDGRTCYQVHKIRSKDDLIPPLVIFHPKGT